jgi:hypothetical protein
MNLPRGCARKSSCHFPRYGQKVRTESQQLRQRFAAPSGFENDASPGRIIPAFLEVRRNPSWALNAEHVLDGEAGCLQLARDLGWQVEVGNGTEPATGVMADRDGIAQSVETAFAMNPALDVAIQWNRETGDVRDGDKPAGAHDASGFYEGPVSIDLVGQMVQRTQ